MVGNDPKQTFVNRRSIQMLIRPGHMTDSRKCAEIHIESRAQMSYLPDLYTPEQVFTWMKDKVFGNEQVLVAEVEGSVVGYASYAGKVLSNLYVRPGFQRCGVGSELLEAALREMPSEVELWVFEANIDAIRFYERNGFKTTSRTSGDNEEELPERLMKRMA